MEDNKLEIVISPGSVSHSSTSCDEWMRKMATEIKGETGTGNYQQEGLRVPRVPSTFRRIEKNENCYDPSMVSLGPYHHGKHELKEMEELKLPMARQFVRDCKVPFEAMWREVKELGASKCYEEGIIAKFNMDDQFAQMMFLDGCFILQFLECFMRKPENLKMSSHDAVLITKDLFLLENQLPFSVLKSLMSFKCKTPDHGGGEGMELFVDFFKRIRAIPPRRESCREKISKYFGKLVPKSLSSPSGQSRFQREPAHLLDFFHMQFVVHQESPGDHPSQTSRQEDDSPTIWHRYYPAEELRDIGIHFKPSKTSHFTDVQFKPTWLAGRLFIPPLSIDDSTKPLLLNLIAFEATVGTSTGWITSYVCFMDSLIDHPEDVKELRSQGILLSTLGSDKQVSELFNEIANNIVPSPYAFIQAFVSGNPQKTFGICRIPDTNVTQYP
ncbi:hypothetical protein DKX38_009035 [Salix brachista]|uniref:Uncharacterized protein n=1 Tax=Salix brachista TaxID=2182728 RepID=A0A5N5M9F1_9ROSI|nr:hypothetical protein DKX38_009035 [Salix brachista]